MLGSVVKKAKKAGTLFIGQNTKTLSSGYLANCIRNTMATVTSEFAKVNQGVHQTCQEGFQLFGHAISPQL